MIPERGSRPPSFSGGENCPGSLHVPAGPGTTDTGRVKVGQRERALPLKPLGPREFDGPAATGVSGSGRGLASRGTTVAAEGATERCRNDSSDPWFRGARGSSTHPSPGCVLPTRAAGPRPSVGVLVGKVTPHEETMYEERVGRSGERALNPAGVGGRPGRATLLRPVSTKSPHGAVPS